MPTTWEAPLIKRPMAVAGAIQERTVPGVPRLAIQPQPSPDTKESDPMTATVIRPDRATHAGPAAPVRQGSRPVPGHIDDAHRGGHLDGGRQRAQHDAPDGMAAPGDGDPGQEQAHHDGVVVGATDEGEQGQRVEHGQHERGTRVPAERAGELGDAVRDQRDAGHRLQAQQHDGDQARGAGSARPTSRPASGRAGRRAPGCSSHRLSTGDTYGPEPSVPGP